MTRLETLAAELLAAHPPREELWLELSGALVQLRASTPALRERLERYFGEVVTPPGPSADVRVSLIEREVAPFAAELADWPREAGKRGPKERYADSEGGRLIAKVRTGMQFVLTERERIAVGPCLANASQVINFIIAQYVGWRLSQGWVLCHAAAVTLNAKGLAIAARSGAGKSTLALHLMRAGASFASNDRLLIRHAGERPELLGVPKMPRVNPGTLLHNPALRSLLSPERRAELQGLPERELWHLEDKHDVIIGEVFGAARTRYHAPLRALVVLSWSAEASTPARFDRVELGARPDLLEQVMKSPGVFQRVGTGAPAPPQSRPEPGAYLRALRGVLVYEATGKADFDAGVELCRRLLQR